MAVRQVALADAIMPLLELDDELEELVEPPVHTPPRQLPIEQGVPSGSATRLYIPSIGTNTPARFIGMTADQQIAQLQRDHLDSRARLTYARAELDRQTELARNNVNAQKTLQQATADHAALLLALRELQALPPQTGGAVRQLAGDAQLALLLCPEVTPQTLETLANWPAERLAVYSPRPDTVRDWLQQAGKPANSYSLLDALLRGERGLAQAQ